MDAQISMSSSVIMPEHLYFKMLFYYKLIFSISPLSRSEVIMLIFLKLLVVLSNIHNRKEM